MSKIIYWNLLILCEMLFQGILGTFAEENIIQSPNHLMRNKRQVLSNNHQAITRMSIKEIPYVVQILEQNIYICIGNILLSNVIITAAHCVEERGPYKIVSNSAHLYEGISHKVMDVISHPEYHPSRYVNDLALVNIHPEIDIERSSNRLIKLHNGFTRPGTTGLVSGWGCIGTGRDGEIQPKQLRSIITPVISNERCRTFYMQHQSNPTIITDRNVCTLDVIEGNKCGNGDSGAPLVIHNELVGVMAWSGNTSGPDVFMNLSHPVYRAWILENIPPHRYYPDSPYHVYNRHHAPFRHNA